MAKESGDCLQAHAPVDSLGRQRVTELVGGHVPDARVLGYFNGAGRRGAAAAGDAEHLGTLGAW
jgi:hypothetical protein